jgi:hypothetical protein
LIISLLTSCLPTGGKNPSLSASSRIAPLNGIIQSVVVKPLDHWLFGTYHTSFAIAAYIAVCAVLSLIATAFMTDYTGKDIGGE